LSLVAPRLLSVDHLLLHGGRGQHSRCTGADAAKQRTVAYLSDDRPFPFVPPAGDATPITQVKVRTRAKSITGFSLSKPVPGFKTGYRFSGSHLTSLNGTQSTIITGENHSLASVNDQYGASGASLIYLSSNIGYYHNYGYNTDLTVNSFI